MQPAHGSIMKTIPGRAASRGIAIGPAFKYRKEELKITSSLIDQPEDEILRLENALDRVQSDLKNAYQETLEEIGEEEAAIFEAHAQILGDPELLKSVREDIKQRKINAETSLKEQSEAYASKLEALDNEYFQARAADIRDVIDRTLRVMLGQSEQHQEILETPSIIVADDLTPSDTIQLDKTLVLGFCTVRGGSTSHTAILARGLGIPAVVGAGEMLLEIPDHTELIVDGFRGEIHMDADPDFIKEYQTRQKAYQQAYLEAAEDAHQPAITRDRHRVEVAANIGSAADLPEALESGAEGIGLLRTEFVYLGRSSLPDESTQAEIYRQILQGFRGKPVILRTLDIGGDKELPYLQLPEEDNPFLGVRAIRLSFQHRDLFKSQLRAALQAGVQGNLKIMFPMISSVQEIRQAKAILQECREELIHEEIPAAGEIAVGIMVEIPSAAILADQLVREVDFFSIGTNDLSQYTYAADRINQEVSNLASGFQPAVLRLIDRVIETAHSHGKWVGCCGELAGKPLAIPILVGLGINELSMNPPAVPFAKQLIRKLSFQDLKPIARSALDLGDHTEVKEWIRKQVPEVEPYLNETPA